MLDLRVFCALVVVDVDKVDGPVRLIPDHGHELTERMRLIRLVQC